MTSTREPIFAVCRIEGQQSSPIGRRTERQTSKDMCSLPSLISSSWRPSLFFSGHFESSSLRLLRKHGSCCYSGWAYFIISLSLMIRLISEITSELTHTAHIRVGNPKPSTSMETYFLCGSRSHYGSLNCSHSALMHFGRLQENGSRILELVSVHALGPVVVRDCT